MNPEVGRWDAIHRDILSARDGEKSIGIQNALIRRLKQISQHKHCSPVVVGWITTANTRGGRQEIKLKDHVGARDPWGHPAIKLDRLEHLQDGALLTFLVELCARGSKISTYSVGIQGHTRRGGRPWYARIDLTEAPEGIGLCSHPLLHAHIGPDAQEDAAAGIHEHADSRKAHRFDVRVPLPWLAPHDALDWLLATVEPRLESSRTAAH